MPIVVVGNKCDLESNRQVRLDQAEAEAKKFGGTHFSASARTGTGVKEVFRGLTESKYMHHQRTFAFSFSRIQNSFPFLYMF